MAAIGNLLVFYEVHDGDNIYRMHPAVLQPGNANMNPSTRAVQDSLVELSRRPRWELFRGDGQVCTLANRQWRIDIQERDEARYLWAFQGPPGPPVYAIVRADRDIERFGVALAKGQVKGAMWNSMHSRHTWYIRVEVLRKDRRRRPQHGDNFVKVPGTRPTLKQCNQATVLTETRIGKDVPNLFMCTEQQPNRAAITPDLSNALVEFLRLWADVFELWTSAKALAELASSMASSDTAHGAVETTAGGLGIVSGGLMIGGLWFPPLLIAGAIAGAVSGVGGGVNAGIDHFSTRSRAQTTMKSHHENILAKLEDIKKAEKAFKATAKVRSFTEKVDAGSTEVIAEYLTAAGTIAADVTSIVAACCMASPTLAAEGGKSLLTAANLAKLPTVGLQSTLSTVSTAASTADVVVGAGAGAGAGAATVSTSAGATDAVAGGAAAGGVASKFAAASGVLGIAAGAVQLGFGINRLASGSSTAAEILKLCESAMSIAKSSQDLAAGCTALMKCAHKLDDTTVLMWMVSEHVGQVVDLE